jgi:2-dehydro-3-deoxyphosphogluconate aldolase/(4S)-4-hydroxy-2-oxoglutarate aldolase
MKKKSVSEQIASFGVIPVIRASSSEEARFAAEAVRSGGIPIVEITMTVPGALQVISGLAKTMPQLLLGAGTVLNKKMARQCADAGAQCLVSPGFDAGMVATAKKFRLVVIAGALTPTEVMAAWDAGADFVKVFPCCNLGGPAYVKALRGPFPQVPLIPTGGVTIETAADYIRAGAAALGVGSELILKDALKARKSEPISDLARRFVELVKEVRKQLTT